MGPEWSWYTSTGPGFTYTVAFPFHSFSYLDKEEERGKMMAEAIGEEKVADLLQRTSPTIRTHYSEIVKHDPELSYRPKAPSEAPPAFMHLSMHWVKPSKTEAYKAMVVKVRDAFAKADEPMGWEAYQMLFGEGTYAYVSQAESAAHFYQAPNAEKVLVKTLGEEAAGKIFKNGARASRTTTASTSSSGLT